MLNGIIASKGIALEKALRYHKEVLEVPKASCDDSEKGMRYVEASLKKSTEALEAIKDEAKNTLDQEHLDIFDAHIQMINDVEIIKEVKRLITDEHYNPMHAYEQATNHYIAIFESMEDDYFKERAADIKDIQYRVLSIMLEKESIDLGLINEPVILVANDLTPSDTAMLNLDYIKGFITEIGGETSHTAIMARALNIPAIVGVKGLLERVENNDLVLLDALENRIVINPTNQEQEAAKATMDARQKTMKELSIYKDKETQTKDGHKVKLFANIGSVKDVESANAQGAEGVGLLRTEFLFMDSNTMPSLDTQIESYKKVFDAISPVIVRTLDIGGDKALPYLSMKAEENPFLGHRAIRLCFEEIELFKTQLKALLIASKEQEEVSVMIPMIARVDEVLKTKSILEEVKQDLSKEKIEYQNNIKLGIMIEIPSAALNIERLAKHVDFISIGSNDLIQYLFAADRMNEKVSYLYDPYDPTLIELIHHVIQGARKHHVETGLCGEIGSNIDIALLLTAMDIDEISMNAGSILETRKALTKVTMEDLKIVLNEVRALDDSQSVVEAMKAFRIKHNIS